MSLRETMWESKNLSDLGDIVTGSTPSTKDSTNYGSDIPFIKPPELRSNFVSGASEMLSEKGAKSARVLPPNSVMVSCIGNLGKVAINKLPVATNQQINSIIPNEDVDSKFLFYQVQSQNFRNQLSALSSATTVSIVNKGNFSKVKIPIPPLPIQHRIVEKIEELFSELDNGVENLKRAQQQLKTYCQAVLKDAFEGKLTKEWRTLRQAQDADDLPTPEELLEQIKTERKAHRERELAKWEKEVEQWERDGEPGRKPRKPRRNYKPIPIDELKIELPNLWMQARLCLLCSDITDGDHQAPPKSETGFPFITISNIDNNKIDFSDTFYVGEKYFNALKKQRKPKKGDVLYTVTGSFGIPVLVDFEKQFCFQRHIGLLRSFKSVNQKWLYYLMQTPNVIQQAKKDATGTAQKTVSLTSLRQFIVPYMSNEEQVEIVNEIESRLSVVDQLEQTIKENLQKAEALRQSILKKAFGGELVKSRVGETV